VPREREIERRLVAVEHLFGDLVRNWRETYSLRLGMNLPLLLPRHFRHEETTPS